MDYDVKIEWYIQFMEILIIKKTRIMIAFKKNIIHGMLSDVLNRDIPVSAPCQTNLNIGIIPSDF